MKNLFSARSIIERDSLIARLEAAGIASVSPPRDMSRKVTSDTVDLSLDGYSVFFDGFAIMVEDADEAKAKVVLNEFLAEQKIPAESSEPTPHWRKFYFCSVFSLMMPILMNGVALYHFYKALQTGERPNRLYLILSWLCLIPGFFLLGYVLRSLAN